MDRKALLIHGGRLIDPAAGIDGSFDLLIEDGRIAAVDRPGTLAKRATQSIDVSGLIVTPGLVDIHVHLREPGQEWKETILTGSEAAVAGGFTAIACMPNTLPAIDTSAVVDFVRKQAERANLCRVYPIGCITVGREGKALAPMLELRDAGCVAFSDDGLPVSNSNIMRRALEYNRMLGTVLTVHEEDLELSHDFSMNESALSLKMGLRGMPGAAEDVMIARDIELARLTGGRVHFCHVSTARGVTLIRRAKEDGIPVTAETTPQHITLTEDAVRGFNTQAKMSMPLRGQADVDAVLAGLSDGTIDCVASDHAPHENDSKAREFEHASMGMLGLQTTVPLVMEKVRAGTLSLNRAIDALTSAPARCFNLTEQSLRVGATADITVIDPDMKLRLTREEIRSKSKNTPYLNAELTGHAVITVVGGEVKFNRLAEGAEAARG